MYVFNNNKKKVLFRGITNLAMTPLLQEFVTDLVILLSKRKKCRI
jgi:hypothetical protein